LSFESVLDDIFELGLNLLRLPEHVSELGSECLVHSLLYSRLGFIAILDDGVLDVGLHASEQLFDHFLIGRVSGDSIVYLLNAF
jgi:hypothetical protein